MYWKPESHKIVYSNMMTALLQRLYLKRVKGSWELSLVKGVNLRITSICSLSLVDLNEINELIQSLF